MKLDELHEATVLTAKDVQVIYRYGSPAATYRAIESGAIPGAFKLGSQWRVSAQAVREQLGIDRLEEAGSTTRD